MSDARVSDRDEVPQDLQLFANELEFVEIAGVVVAAAFEVDDSSAETPSYEANAFERAWDELSAAGQASAANRLWHEAGSVRTGTAPMHGWINEADSDFRMIAEDCLTSDFAGNG